jgi:hypothetical protein
MQVKDAKPKDIIKLIHSGHVYKVIGKHRSFVAVVCQPQHFPRILINVWPEAVCEVLPSKTEGFESSD